MEVVTGVAVALVMCIFSAEKGPIQMLFNGSHTTYLW